jgi:D-beta-D-heptose 7-phosphate kinase/D-beta-D-heptose 1-phosphate adenosyltransferase
MKKPATKKQKIVVAVSGGFDPIHIGHVRMFEAAKKFGTELVVILNNDNWLLTKKGYAFMKEKERKEIIESLRVVDRVVLTKHKKNDADRSVSKALGVLKPNIFANGGDRKNIADIPEATVCARLGIKMIFNVGKGGKVQSSSWLVDGAKKSKAASR